MTDGAAELRQLMSAYFHQDWTVEYDGAWESAVDDFAQREPDRVAGAIAHIDDLLGAGRTDDEVAQALDDLGSYRHAGDEPGAYASWLRAVAARLRAVDPA